MKITIFEGTPEEYAATFSQISTETRFSATQGRIEEPRGSVYPMEKKSPQERVKRKWHRCIAETADGCLKKYNSVKDAFRWYVNASNQNREYRTYVMFYAALKKGPVAFADTTITMLSEGGVA